MVVGMSLGGGGVDSRGGWGHLGDQIGHSKCNKKG